MIRTMLQEGVDSVHDPGYHPAIQNVFSLSVASREAMQYDVIKVVSRGRRRRASLSYRLQVVCLLVGLCWAGSPPGTA